LGRPAVLSDLTNDTITLWLNDMVTQMDAKGDSRHTAISYATRVLTLWRFLNDMGEMPTRPIIEMPTAPDPVPIALSDAELRRLFEDAQCRPGFICGVPARWWWPALFAVAFSTSERKGALFALRWEWIDLKDKVAQVPAGARKGKRKSATYKLWGEVIPLLERIRERHARGNASFLIISPQSDPTQAEHPEAERRLRRALAELRSEGIDAHGQIAQPDPFSAALDAVRERDRTPHPGTGPLRRADDLAHRLVEHAVVEGLQADSYVLRVHVACPLARDEPGPFLPATR
jgi:integrase